MKYFSTPLSERPAIMQDQGVAELAAYIEGQADSADADICVATLRQLIARIRADDARVEHFPRAPGNDADPAEGGWVIDPAYLRRVKQAIKDLDATFIDMEDIEAVLMAVENVEGVSNVDLRDIIRRAREALRYGHTDVERFVRGVLSEAGE